MTVPMSKAVHLGVVALRQMRALLVKELRQLVRDRLLFGFVVYIFTLHIVISARGFSSDLHNAPLLIHDADQTPASRDLLYGLRLPYFRFSGEASPKALVRALDDGTALVAVDVPAGFDRHVRSGHEPARVQALVDSSKVTLGYLASSYANRSVQSYAETVSADRLNRLGIDAKRLPSIESRERTWFNFSLNDRWPGALTVLIIMMTFACVMLPAASALREKERGTVEQLLVSPITPLQIMSAKVLAMVLVTVLGSILSVYLVLEPLFHVPMRGDVVFFFATVALYAFTNAGLGLMLATVARTSGQLGLLVILLVMPMIQLSGTNSPVESMSRGLQLAMNFSPLYHFVRIAFGIFFRGEGPAALAGPLAAMSALGLVLFLLGLWRFRRQFS